ncbi:hypothetical protein [Nonomuraea sp. NPDC048916]
MIQMAAASSAMARPWPLQKKRGCTCVAFGSCPKMRRQLRRE